MIEYLYHYYEEENGPFLNLSDLDIIEAQKILDSIKNKNVFASKRDSKYLQKRRDLEQIARRIFLSKGGKPLRKGPHYMVLGECKWLESWYESGKHIKFHISEFDPNTISFTYGDLFPTFNVNDEKEYRNNVYTYQEIINIIDKYGLPQVWNFDGRYGPERYIEVQVWCDIPK